MFFTIVIVEIKIIVVYGILGGQNVDISDARCQVSYADTCGAVLIHKQWALTTAHCGVEGTYIRYGSSYRIKGSKGQVLSHFLHPKYQHHHQFDYDVQLLMLFKPLLFSRLVGSVKICGGYCGGEVRVFGWGYGAEKGEYNGILQGIEIKVVPKEECQEVQQSWYNHTLTSRMFCAGGNGRDACQGDSGGAAIQSGQLAGLSSFGYGCGRNIPGVYTNVTQKDIRSWITRLAGV